MTLAFPTAGAKLVAPMSIAFASFAAAWLVAGQTSTATAASPGSSDTEEARLVDMVVADVDGAVVTYSELLSEANLLLLESRGARVARAARLSQNLLRAVLQSMVHRELLLGEIRRLQLRAIDGAEVDRRLVELRRRFDNEAGWQSFLIAAGFRDPDDPGPSSSTRVAGSTANRGPSRSVLGGSGSG